jgi:hypothetical protein
MRCIFRFSIAAALLALLALPAAAQQIKQPRPKNPDDEGLHYVVLREFSKVNSQLAELSARLTTLENDLARLKQQAGEVTTNARDTQTVVRDTDRNITQKLQETDQKLLTLRNDVIQLRSDLANLTDLIRRNQSAMMTVPSAVPEILQEPVGYITELIGESEVKFSIGAGSVVSRGMRLGVYAAADPRTQIGILVVSEVVDANNAKADIIRKDPGASFKFSDLVRPIS